MTPRLATSTTARCLRTTVRSAQQLTYQPRGYSTTNPNPPLGKKKKNASSDQPARVALIGARRYTGTALIDLFSKHPHIDLKYIATQCLQNMNLALGFDEFLEIPTNALFSASSACVEVLLIH